jgi:hypothetical protein
MTMRSIQSFGALLDARFWLSSRKASNPIGNRKSANMEKMSFIHLFLQYIECLSYIDAMMPLLICFPRHKSLINSIKNRRKS